MITSVSLGDNHRHVETAQQSCVLCFGRMWREKKGITADHMTTATYKDSSVSAAQESKGFAISWKLVLYAINTYPVTPLTASNDRKTTKLV